MRVMCYKNMLSHIDDNKVPALGLQEQACMQYEGTYNSLQSTLNLSGLLCCTYLKVTPNSHWWHPKNCTSFRIDLLEVLSVQKSASLKAVFTLGNIKMLVGRWVAEHQEVLYYQG
jgi:hypothetical protein